MYAERRRITLKLAHPANNTRIQKLEDFMPRVIAEYEKAGKQVEAWR